MTVHRVAVPLADAPYDVLVGHRLLGRLDEHLSATAAARALVVTQDPVIEAGHVAPVEDALARAGLEVARHVVPDGEAAKSADVLAECWRAAARLPLSRADVVVAVGGGVVGDLAGFLAATINRGVDVIQVPTTLLAQVDAAIGGKTGINLPEGKNLVGAFHQPRLVVADTATLSTLPERVLTEGYGEIVKAGLIRDPAILHLLEERRPGQRADPLLLEELVRRSVAVKAAVVAGDEREAGERAHLNLGHTFGHAVEALTGYSDVLHGEAVSIGTVVALRLGRLLGLTDEALVARAERLLASLGLPTTAPALDREQVWQVMARDKKAAADGVRFVLVTAAGEVTVTTPPGPLVDAAIDEVTRPG